MRRTIESSSTGLVILVDVLDTQPFDAVVGQHSGKCTCASDQR